MMYPTISSYNLYDQTPEIKSQDTSCVHVEISRGNKSQQAIACAKRCCARINRIVTKGMVASTSSLYFLIWSAFLEDHNINAPTATSHLAQICFIQASSSALQDAKTTVKRRCLNQTQ